MRAVPDYGALVARLKRVCTNVLFYMPGADTEIATLLYRAAVAIIHLDFTAHFYEQEARQARTEPTRLIVDDIPLQEWSPDPDALQFNVREIVVRDLRKDDADDGHAEI